MLVPARCFPLDLSLVSVCACGCGRKRAGCVQKFVQSYANSRLCNFQHVRVFNAEHGPLIAADCKLYVVMLTAIRCVAKPELAPIELGT